VERNPIERTSRQQVRTRAAEEIARAQRVHVTDHARMAQRQQVRAERMRNHGVRFRHRAQPFRWPQISPGEQP